MATALIITAVAIFLAGAVAGILIIVSVGIGREERRRHSLVREAPDRVSQGARLLTGLYVRRPTDSNPAAADRKHMHV